jgi:hypothetical protein
MYKEMMNYMRDVNVPLGLKRFTALMATSVFMEGRTFLRSGPIHRLYPNLFIIIIANPGQAKSLMSNIILDVVRLYNSYQDAFPEMKINVGPKKVNPAAMTEQLCDTVWHKTVYINGKEEITTPCYLPSSELSVLVENSKYGNVLTDLLDYYDCPPIFDKFTRMNKLEVINRPIITMIGATTPAFWNQFMPSNLAKDGFSSRTLLYHFNEFIWREADMKWGSFEDLQLCVDAAVRLKSLSGEFTMSPEAKTWISTEFND